MMLRRRRIKLSIAALALGVGLTACGGDDDEPTAATTTTTTVDADATSTTAAPDATTSTTPTTAVEPQPEEGAVDPGDTGNPDEGFGDDLVFVADLTPGDEVPGPGDPDATGRIEFTIVEADEWCFDMVVVGLGAAPTEAHVHAGAAGVAGDVVVPLGKPTSTEGDRDIWTDVCVAGDPTLVDQVFPDPAAFYVNVHTSAFPAGAVRGPLQLSTIFDLQLG